MSPEFAVERDGRRVVVTGDVDMATAPRLREVLAECAGPLLVDLSRTGFMDSAGVAALFDHAADGLELIVAPDTPVMLVLEVTKLTEVATVRPPD